MRQGWSFRQSVTKGSCLPWLYGIFGSFESDSIVKIFLSREAMVWIRIIRRVEDMGVLFLGGFCSPGDCSTKKTSESPQSEIIGRNVLVIWRLMNVLLIHEDCLEKWLSVAGNKGSLWSSGFSFEVPALRVRVFDLKQQRGKSWIWWDANKFKNGGFKKEEHLSIAPHCFIEIACWRHCWQKK